MLRLPEGWLALFLVCCAPWVPVAARAQEPAADASSVDAARRLFAEGLAFVELGNWVSAEERFRQVLAQRSSHVVVYNLASALVHLDRPVEGAELLRSILRAADADAETREAAQQLLSETEPRIGTLTVRVSGDATFTAFTLDDKPIELTAQVQTIAVDPGEHRIAALRDGAEVASQRVALGNGQLLQAEVELLLPALIAPQQALRPEPAPARSIATRATTRRRQLHEGIFFVTAAVNGDVARS